MPSIHLLIKGKVQGVFYRASAKKVADEMGVCGWIKNTSDGDVEALISGTGEQVQAFEDWTRKGPGRAKVTDVIVTNCEPVEFDNFSIER